MFEITPILCKEKRCYVIHILNLKIIYLPLILFSTGLDSFKYNLCGMVINLFLLQENAPKINQETDTNKFIFSMDVNFHQVSMETLMKEKEYLKTQGDFMETIKSGRTTINNSDLKVYIHTVEEGSKNKLTSLKSVNDVRFPNGMSECLYHPKLIAKKLSAKNVVNGQQNTNLRHSANRRFQRCIDNNDAYAVFCWLQNFESVTLSTCKDLNDLAGALGMEKEYTTCGDFKANYKVFKQAFQEKFKIFFSILDGNHRSTVISKLIDEEPFTDFYEKSEKDVYYKLEGALLNRVLSLFTVEIEYSSTVLIHPDYARSVSAMLRQAQEKKFGHPYVDILSSYVKECQDELPTCNKTNLYNMGYGPGQVDQFMKNVETGFEKMMKIVEYNVENFCDNKEGLEKFLRNRSMWHFVPWYPKTFYNRYRGGKKKVDKKNNIWAKTDGMMFMDMMRLCSCNMNVLKKYIYFMKTSKTEEYHRDENRFGMTSHNHHFIGNLIQIVYRMSNTFYDALVHELAKTKVWKTVTGSKEFEGKKRAMSNNLPSTRIMCFMSFSMLSNIIDTWNLIGYDPEILLKSVNKFGSVQLKSNTMKVLSDKDKPAEEEEKKPFLIHLLEEYEIHQNFIIEGLKHDEEKHVFKPDFLEKVCSEFGNKTKSHTNENLTEVDWDIKDFRFQQKFWHSKDDSVYVLPSFQTFMTLYFPYIATDKELDKMTGRKYVFANDDYFAMINSGKTIEKNVYLTHLKSLQLVKDDLNLKKDITLEELAKNVPQRIKESTPRKKRRQSDEIDNETTKTTKTDTSKSIGSSTKKSKTSTGTVDTPSQNEKKTNIHSSVKKSKTPKNKVGTPSQNTRLSTGGIRSSEKVDTPSQNTRSSKAKETGEIKFKVTGWGRRRANMPLPDHAFRTPEKKKTDTNRDDESSSEESSKGDDESRRSTSNNDGDGNDESKNENANQNKGNETNDGIIVNTEHLHKVDSVIRKTGEVSTMTESTGNPTIQLIAYGTNNTPQKVCSVFDTFSNKMQDVLNVGNNTEEIDRIKVESVFNESVEIFKQIRIRVNNEEIDEQTMVSNLTDKSITQEMFNMLKRCVLLAEEKRSTLQKLEEEKAEAAAAAATTTTTTAAAQEESEEESEAESEAEAEAEAEAESEAKSEAEPEPEAEKE